VPSLLCSVEIRLSLSAVVLVLRRVLQVQLSPFNWRKKKKKKKKKKVNFFLLLFFSLTEFLSDSIDAMRVLCFSRSGQQSFDFITKLQIDPTNKLNTTYNHTKM
jgi:hypothetical protein